MYSAELKTPVIHLTERIRGLYSGYDTVHFLVYGTHYNDGHIEMPYGIRLILIPKGGNGSRRKVCEIPYFEPCETLEDLVRTAKELGRHEGDINRLLWSYAKGRMCKDDP